MLDIILPDATLQKQCTTCFQWKSATTEFFCINRSKKDGLNTICKACCIIRNTHLRDLHNSDRVRRGSRKKKISDIPKGTKRCYECEKLFPATSEFFQKDRSRKDGLCYLCKVCCTIRDAHKPPRRKPVRKKQDKISDIPEGMKRCSKCKEVLLATLEFFVKDKATKDGLYPSCRQCHKGKYRKAHPKEYLDIPVPQGYKLCAKCQSVYLATTEYFYRHPQCKDGLNPRCKQCRSDDKKAAYVPKPRPNITPGHKVCPECGQEKFASYDNFHRSGKNAFTHVCKDCWKGYVKRLAEERAAKPQEPMCTCTGPCGRTLPATSEYFPREGPNLRTRCKECRKKGQKANYKLHEEERKARRREYMNANRELIRLYCRNRHALKKNAPGFHTVEDIKRQYERQRGHCYYCHKKLGTGKRAYHVDHIVPLTRGGSNWPDNLVIACPYCNQSKQDKLLHEWIEGGRLL